tara:strand:+ start:1653 stop:1928 length:276 start_codon:yes stop_codon:yes gene_type:complete
MFIFLIILIFAVIKGAIQLTVSKKIFNSLFQQEEKIANELIKAINNVDIILEDFHKSWDKVNDDLGIVTSIVKSWEQYKFSLGSTLHFIGR